MKASIAGKICSLGLSGVSSNGESDTKSSRFQRIISSSLRTAFGVEKQIISFIFLMTVIQSRTS